MSSDETPPRHVLLYMKPECHLCDTAREWLEDFAADPAHFVPFELEEIDIRRDLAVFEEYRSRIPVILVGGAIVAEGRMEHAAWAALRDSLSHV